jgi:molecular chaperone GrpE
MMKKAKSDAAAADFTAQEAAASAGKNVSPAADQEAAAAEAATAALPGDAPQGEQQALQEALAAKTAELAELTDKFLRLAAEFDNYRRRSQKEKDALYCDSVVAVVKEILPVFDNLSRAAQAAGQAKGDEARKIGEGVEMIQKQIEQALARLNVTAIECVGQPFDPQLHEAVMHVVDETVGPSVVVEELQKGYRREDRVIRHSIVKVAN